VLDHPFLQQQAIYALRRVCTLTVATELMATHRSLQLGDTTHDIIQHWQDGASHEYIVEEPGKIGQLLQGCLELFGCLVRDTPGFLRLPKKS
jgi:hypothetical protein